MCNTHTYCIHTGDGEVGVGLHFASSIASKTLEHSSVIRQQAINLQTPTSQNMITGIPQWTNGNCILIPYNIRLGNTWEHTHTHIFWHWNKNTKILFTRGINSLLKWSITGEELKDRHSLDILDESSCIWNEERIYEKQWLLCQLLYHRFYPLAKQQRALPFTSLSKQSQNDYGSSSEGNGTVN